MAKAKQSEETTTLTIKAPDIRTVILRITGTSPLMLHRFGKKGEVKERQEAGSAGKNKKARASRDFERDFNEARHVSTQGWDGIPAPAFRAAMISACKLVGFAMTKAKLCVFIEADGMCKDEGTPLVRLIADEPEQSILPVRNATGVMDLRSRPLWREWAADLRVRYDADQFTVNDVANLVMRVGIQVGIGEGRNDSKKSAGLGYGTFRIAMEGDA